MKKLVFLLLNVAFITSLRAQVGGTKDLELDLNTENRSDDWYNSPWTWVIIAAFIILILVAVTKGWKRKE